MSRQVRIAVVQPPATGEQVSHDHMREQALSLLEDVAAQGADIICLPEYVNAMGRNDVWWQSPPVAGDEPMLAQVTDIARIHSSYVILPLLEGRDSGSVNTSLLIDRKGNVAGRYDKTHLTAVERDDQNVCPGDSYPVFETDFGRIGIMTCYDAHFPEVSRILALQGAEILFFPSLQRRLTAEALDLQVRCRAIDNCVYIARSSYGTPQDVPWMPGMTAGKSCVVDFEGTVLADAGPRVGVATHVVDLDRPRLKERSFGGEVGDAAQFMRHDRRPETYGRLLEP
jgi:predicted amidohydrolase